MSWEEWAAYFRARRLMRDFYADPENERKFQEWLKKRKQGRGDADGNSSRTPVGMVGIHDDAGRTNHTASATC